MLMGTLKLPPIRIPILATAALALTAAANRTAAPARADNLMAEYYLPGTNTGGTHNITGRAIFSYLTSAPQGNLQIELINDSTPDSANDLISGIQFNISTPSGSELISTPRGPSGAAGDTADPYAWSQSGGTEDLTQIVGLSPMQTQGSAAGITANLVSPWTVAHNAGQYSLSAVSGQAADLLGPEAAASTYQYFSNTSSVSASDPILAGPVFFDFTVPGLTGTDTIGNVIFDYGSSGDSIAGNPAAVPAPEPTAWLILIAGAMGFPVITRCKRKS